ncbi:putative phosphothreonine lyase domain-containing protein [Cupriavidus necator]
MTDDRPSLNEKEVWLHVAAPSLKSFESNESTGKWCIFRSEHEIDQSWATVKDLAAAEKILLAKVSTAIGRRYHDGHVICIYTLDWNNHADLMTVREVLRAAGFTEEMGYKRDVDTTRRIYGPNEWYVRA